MHLRILLIALAFCFFSLCSPAVRADAAAQARQQIQAAYNSQNAAMGRKDAKGAVAHTDPGYVGKSQDGQTQSYATRVSGLPALFRAVKTIQIKTTIRKFAMSGSTTALVEAANHMSLAGIDPTTHRPGGATFVYIVHDKWVKRPTGWMLLQTSEVSRTRMP